MGGVTPPPSDPNRTTDAVARVQADAAAIDGTPNDGLPDVACGGSGGGGPLPRSGQTTSYGSGSDGDLRPGAAMSFTDNGDGTITDNVTGLMWEKKDDSNGIHGKDNTYTCVGSVVW